MQLISCTKHIARFVERVLKELDSQWLNKATDVGYRPRMVIEAPYYQLLLREDWSNEGVELRTLTRFA